MPAPHPVRWIVILLCGALAAFGCASTDTEQGATGSLSLDLVLAGDIEIDVVDWEITGNGMDMGGSIDVSGPGSTASFEVFGLPVGQEPYVVELSAVSVDQQVTCRGSAEFDVEVGVSTPVMVILNCKLPQELGAVRVNGKFNICAQLTKMVVAPLQTSVGNDISLFSTASDEEGDPIAYMWTSHSGSIADPVAASTTYTCTEVGDDDITVLVTDDDGTYCMSMWTVRVTCVSGEGNPCDGVICEDDGNECTDEACNPANGQCETSNNSNACEDDTGTCNAGVCEPNAECAVDGDCPATGNECIDAVCNAGTCGTSNNTNACDGGAGTCSAGVCEPNAQVFYEQDFESLDQASGTALGTAPGGAGFLVFGNEFLPDGTPIQGYGPFSAPNGTPGFCSIALGQGGGPQGDQVLVIYSDYNNTGNQEAGNLVEANTFQEPFSNPGTLITAADLGTYTFSFDAKRGDINDPTLPRCDPTSVEYTPNPPCDSTARAFIKTLDPSAGFATTNDFEVITTAIPDTWNRYSIDIVIDNALIGQILQFGFAATATNFEPSGVFYDNLLVTVE